MGLFGKFAGDVFNNVLDTLKNGKPNEGGGSADFTPAPAVEEKKDMELRFGSSAPVPYADNINGTTITLMLNFYGTAKVSACDSALLKANGGLDGLQIVLRTQIVAAALESIMKCAQANVRFAMLPMKSNEIAENVRASLQDKWRSSYGVSLDSISIQSITLTEESMRQYQELRNAQMGL